MFTDYWKYIEERLHEESMLHYPNNKLREILQSFLNGILNDVYEDSFDLMKQSFLVTMNGKYLDIKAEEYGLKRKENESDDELRQRIFNATSTYLSVNFIKLQKTLIYTKKHLNDSIREKMSSNNPYLNNEYAVIPPDVETYDFLENDVVYEKVYQLYKKGWK